LCSFIHRLLDTQGVWSSGRHSNWGYWATKFRVRLGC